MKLTGEWISGFVDGGQCFHIQRPQEKSNDCEKHRFTCRLNRRSADVAHAIRKYFGCGTVRPLGKDEIEYVMSNPQHLRDHCVPFFKKYPLLTKEKHSFFEFAERLTRQGLATECSKGEKSPAPIQSTGGAQKLASAISPDWFRGIVDAQALFSLEVEGETSHPHFLLGIRGEPLIMDGIRSLIRCGKRFSRGDGMEMIQVSPLVDLEEKLFPFFETRGSKVLLRTIKRIAYQKFRRIVRSRIEGRDSSEKGKERSVRLIRGVNQINALFRPECAVPPKVGRVGPS